MKPGKVQLQLSKSVDNASLIIQPLIQRHFRTANIHLLLMKLRKTGFPYIISSSYCKTCLISNSKFFQNKYFI